MIESVRYLRLTDYDNLNTIIKQIGRKFYGYKNGSWKRRGLSLGYFHPDALEFECYEEITEDEAMRLINKLTQKN